MTYRQDFEDSQGANDRRRATDPQVEVLMHKVTRIADDMNTISQTLAEMTKQMGRLVLVEERGAQTTATLAETQRDFKSLNERISRIELAMVKVQGSSKWVDMAITGIVVAVGTVVANKLLH